MKKGRRPVDLMNKAITKGADDAGKKYWKCVLPDCRYRASSNAQQDRVYKHAAGCEALGCTHPDIQHAIIDLQSRTSLGAKLQQDSAAAISAGNSHSELPSCASSSITVSSAKKQKVEGDISKWAREGGKAKKREEVERMQQITDHRIMQLVCVHGLVPNIIDSPQWKDFTADSIHPNYNPTSADTFGSKIIPKEAAFIQKEQLKILQESENITITFNGNSTRRDSIYFVYATTPNRNSYFIDGHIGLDARHTTKWITDRLLTVNASSYHCVSY